MPQSETISHDSRNNPSYIERHKNLFDIEPSHLLREFEAFTGQARGWGLECSCKVQSSRLHAARFNLFRPEPSLTDYQAILAFFQRVEARIGVTLDDRWLVRFLGNRFDPANLARIGVGIDARSDFPGLKFWIFPGDWPEGRARAVSFCEDRPDLRALFAHADAWFVGFDLSLNGRCEFELYLGFELSDHEPSARQLTECLAPATQPWVVKSRQIGVAFSPGRSDRVVYFRPFDPDSFIAGLGSDQAKHVHARYRGLSPLAIIIGFPESRMCGGVTDTVNLYYPLTVMTPGQMPTGRPDPDGLASSAERLPVLAVM
jgi:LynF/TruF/PatF family peptide O-prenyltransferase